VSGPAITIAELEFAYGERKVLRGLSFEVHTGEIFGLLGPNGSGKTTTFKILSTFFSVAAGKVQIFGTDPGVDPATTRRDLGVVFQSPSLDKRLTVRENLRHQGHLYGLSGSELEERIVEQLEHAGLAARADDVVHELSGGLQRRAELAKGLLHRPKLLILDEPSTGLDPAARIDLWKTLNDLKSQGTTILLTTHLMEEAQRCDRLAILHEGNVVALGSPDELTGAIGGDVLSVECSTPEAMAQKVQEKFGGTPVVVDGTLRIERPDAHSFIPQLVEAFPGSFSSLTLSKPTLEDVFIRKTGHKFWREQA
jgi:ABC-2 type transport system ATP-binding protein